MRLASNILQEGSCVFPGRTHSVCKQICAHVILVCLATLSSNPSLPSWAIPLLQSLTLSLRDCSHRMASSSSVCKGCNILEEVTPLACALLQKREAEGDRQNKWEWKNGADCMSKSSDTYMQHIGSDADHVSVWPTKALPWWKAVYVQTQNITVAFKKRKGGKRNNRLRRPTPNTGARFCSRENSCCLPNNHVLPVSLFVALSNLDDLSVCYTVQFHVNQIICWLSKGWNILHNF